MCLDLFSIQGMTDITDGRLVRGRCLQLEILLDTEGAGCITVCEPSGHRGMWRTLRINELHSESAERIAQHFDELFGFTRTPGVDDKPAIYGINPRARRTALVQRAGTQFFCFLFLLVVFLTATDGKSLSFCVFCFVV